MKKYTVWTAVLLILGGAVAVAGQSSRSVAKNVLTSPSNPRVKIAVDKKLKYVGSQEFVLFERAKAEQFFFVEAKGNNVSRLMMVQFERFLPGKEGSYKYDEQRSLKIGGNEYFASSENIPNVPAALAAVPGSDTAKAAAFLQKRGFLLTNSIRYQRFVRVLDNEKRSEIILLYVEDTSTKSSKDLEKIALGSFSIVK